MRPLGMTFNSTTHHIQSSHSNHHTDTARCISFLCLLVINLYIAKRSAPMRCRSLDQWIGLRENLQESPIFDGKIYGFL